MAKGTRRKKRHGPELPRGDESDDDEDPNEKNVEDSDEESDEDSDEDFEFALQPGVAVNGILNFKKKAHKDLYDRATNQSDQADLEVAMYGVGIDGGFQNTSELKAMKYVQAMETEDKPEWDKVVKEEHRKFEDHKVWKSVPKKDVPENAKIFTATWAMKKKANRTYKAKLTAHGFEQATGVHYNENDISSPVVHDISVRMVLILSMMAGWYRALMDVSGAFLNGRSENGEQIYVEVPQGFERFYPKNVLLLLLNKWQREKDEVVKRNQRKLKLRKQSWNWLEHARVTANDCYGSDLHMNGVGM